jgi:opacity protein-like surface antigen
MIVLRPLVLVSFCAFAFTTWAQSVNQSADKDDELKSRALSEIQQPGKIKNAPSDVQLSGTGMLSLKDPRPEIVGRKWDYFLGLSAQRFEPQGAASNDLTASSFELGNAGQTVMPALALGFRAPLYSQDQSWQLNWGLGAKVGYASQSTTATFTTGYKHSDVRLTSTLISANPQLSFTALRAKWLTAIAGYEWGNLTYTQSSSDELANFSVHSAYTGWNLGLDFNLTSNWAITTMYTQRRLTSKQDLLALQQDNYELGTRILW